MEEDLKLLKMEYLSNHLLDQTQIWNLCLYDQTIVYKSLKRRNFKLKLRWPKQILQILKMKRTHNGRRPQVERCPQSVQNVTYEFLGGN